MKRPMALCFAVLTALALLASAVAVADDNEAFRDQLRKFNGGCPPNPAEDCRNVQFSVHRAPMCTNGPNVNVQIYSTSMVRSIGEDGANPLAGGSSTLVRAADGVAFNLSTTGLRPWAPYTVWYVGFNPDNPCVEAGCTCTGADLRPGLDGVFYATGGRSEHFGTSHFAGYINYGDLPTGDDQVVGDFDAPLQQGAEIHLVVRAHGRSLRR